MKVSLLLLFIPIIEIAGFIAIGKHIGIVTSILLCFLSGLIGSSIIRTYGLGALFKARQHFQERLLPVEEVFNSVFFIIAGILLIIPGFITDFIGLSLLIPNVRILLRQFIIRTGTFSHSKSSFYTNNQENEPHLGEKPIEGHYERLDNKE